MQSVTNEPFTHYAEINVDAPRLWEVFSDLCNVLLDSPATFVVGGLDSELVPVGPVNVHASTQLLAQHQYQLAHDGFLQYSLVSDHDGKVTEIFVTPEKYLKVWMNDETTFRGVMARHEIGEASSLKFLDEFPRTTVALSPGAASVRPTESLIKYLQDEILVVGSNGN